MEQHQNNIDPLTREKFELKRSNQKFASSKNRIKFHNEKAKKLRLKLASINKPLLQNFRLLDSIMKNENEKIFHRQFLLGLGINLALFTNAVKYNNNNCISIYNFIIVNEGNENIKIVRQ